MELADQAVSQFLARPILARIASVNPNSFQPQVDPVWFYWDGKTLWFSSAFGSEHLILPHECEQCALVIESVPVKNGITGLLIEGGISCSESATLSKEIKKTIIARYADQVNLTTDQILSWTHDPKIELFQLIPLEIHAW